MKPANYDQLWSELSTLLFLPLNGGRFAIIDGVDAPLSLLQWWCGDYPKQKWNGHTRYLHRVILNVGSGVEVDHRNRNKLDSRRSNLRIASRGQNQANAPYPNKTGFRGVYYVPSVKKYAAVVSLPKIAGEKEKKEFVGSSYCKIEAAKMRDNRAKEIWGEFAFLNFPD